MGSYIVAVIIKGISNNVLGFFWYIHTQVLNIFIPLLLNGLKYHNILVYIQDFRLNETISLTALAFPHLPKANIDIWKLLMSGLVLITSSLTVNSFC